jgi:hypothetical protein
MCERERGILLVVMQTPTGMAKPTARQQTRPSSFAKVSPPPHGR